MQRRGLPPPKLSATPLWQCSISLTFPTATSKTTHVSADVFVLAFLRELNPPCVTTSAHSVKSCFHIMDVCWTRPSAYESANRNKGPFIRPVTTTTAPSVNHPFSKMTGVHTQVRQRIPITAQLPCRGIAAFYSVARTCFMWTVIYLQFPKLHIRKTLMKYLPKK